MTLINKSKLNSLGYIYIQCSFKNTIISLTNANSQKLGQWSSKSLKKIERKKNTPYNIQIITTKAIQFAKKKKYKIFKIFIKGRGFGRFNVIKHLKYSFKKKIISIEDITPIPFNGCRSAKKKRR